MLRDSEHADRERLSTLITALHRKVEGGDKAAFRTFSNRADLVVSRSSFHINGVYHEQWDFYLDKIRLCTAIADKRGKLGMYSYPNGYQAFQDWLPNIAGFRERPWYDPLRWIQGRVVVKLAKAHVY